MNMRVKGAVLAALVVAVALSYVSGFFRNLYMHGTFPFVMVVADPVPGISYWGHPLPWLSEDVVPMPPPKEVIWQNLAADVVFWFLIVLGLLLLFFSPSARRIYRRIRLIGTLVKLGRRI